MKFADIFDYVDVCHNCWPSKPKYTTPTAHLACIELLTTAGWNMPVLVPIEYAAEHFYPGSAPWAWQGEIKWVLAYR